MDEAYAEALAALPRANDLGEAAGREFALQYPAFVALVDDAPVAGAGVYKNHLGYWYAWAIIPAIGTRNLRWVMREIFAFLTSFNEPVYALISDGAGYVFAEKLGFTNVTGIEKAKGQTFIRLKWEG